MALYLPDSVDFDSNCVIVLDNYTARVYEQLPSDSNFDGSYTDYALDNHYISYYGLSNQTDYPSQSSCYPTSQLTHNIIDRTDFLDIFIIGTGIFLITFLCFYKLLTYLFRGWF